MTKNEQFYCIDTSANKQFRVYYFFLIRNQVKCDVLKCYQYKQILLLIRVYSLLETIETSDQQFNIFHTDSRGVFDLQSTKR